MRWFTLLSIRFLTVLSQPLATIIPLQALQNVLTFAGYPAVIAFVLIESSGIPFPGETMLLLAAFFAATNHTLQIPIVIACAAFGAIVGDNIGYLVGRTGGRALVQRYGKYLFLKQEHLDHAERFFNRHGNKTVFFGRFIAVLRAWAAFLGGVNHMQWRTFLIYNAAGGIIWATIYGTLAFIGGRYFHDNFTQIDSLFSAIGWTGIIIIIVAAIGLLIFFRLRRGNHLHEAAVTRAQQEQATADETASTPGTAGTTSGTAEQPLGSDTTVKTK